MAKNTRLVVIMTYLRLGWRAWSLAVDAKFPMITFDVVLSVESKTQELPPIDWKENVFGITLFGLTVNRKMGEISYATDFLSNLSKSSMVVPTIELPPPAGDRFA
jgi:hypothetical protein